MWEKIKNSGLIVYLHHTKGHLTIPEASALLTANKLLNMQYWLFDEFISDCKENIDLVENLGKDINKEQNFINRNTSRTLSYINQACVIEYILSQSYKDMFTAINKYIDVSIMPDSEMSKKREREVTDIFAFRNMVSAHTVYGSSRASDNASLKFSSLMSILGSSFADNDPSSFGLGYAGFRIANQDPSRKIPGIILKELHEKMIVHYQEWEKMFIGTLNNLSIKLPIEKDGYRVLGPNQVAIESTKIYKNSDSKVH